MKKSYFLIIFFLLISQISAQSVFKLTGTVKDIRTNEPLIGANVFIKGTSIGAAVDVNGNYTINVPRNIATNFPNETVTLEVSFIGYQRGAAQVRLNREEIRQDFVLREDVLNMETVVVTGMGMELSKQKLGVSIGNVTGDAIVNSKALDVISGLQGKVANVEITSSSGDPGASSYIRIRGANSITGGTQPLIVVDGSPINNQELGTDLGGVTQQNRASDINPKDIESIDVLKGAAAAALYGSRAQNGVILIKTKGGKIGRTKVAYDVTYTFDEVTQLQPYQKMFGQGVNGAVNKTSPFSWGPKLDANTPVYDNDKNIFKTGHTTDHGLSISGGNEWTTYYLSLGRSYADGIIKGKSNYERNSIRIKASQRINEEINVTGNFSYVDVNSDRVQKGSNVSGLLLGAWRTPPDFNNEIYKDPVTGLHRSYRLQNPTSLKQARGYDNPFFVSNEHVNISEVGRAFGNLKVDYDPLSWLNISYILGHDYAIDERREVLPLSSAAQPDGRVNRTTYKTVETDGNLIVTAKQNLEYANTNLTLMLGHNMNQRVYNFFFTGGTGMAVEGFNQLDNISSYTPDEYESKLRSESYFGQLTVEMFNQLYVTAALRNDGSSTFGESKKRHWYPKFSAAWDFTKNEMLQGQGLLSFGKLRLAYGEAGLEPGVYATISAYGTSGSAFGDSWGPILSSNGFGFGGFYTSGAKGQKNILPQRSKEFEIGMDLGFFDDRLGVDFTYYDSKTTDALYSQPLSPSSGYTSQVQNNGIISNKGYELVINAQPINTQNFKWDLRLIYAKNKNEVKDLAGAEFIGLGGFTSANGAAMLGLPIGVIRGYDIIRFGRGIVYAGVDIDKAYTGWKEGDAYVHTSGYYVRDPQLRVIGDPNPDWTGSIYNSFTLFNELEVSFLIDIKQGGDVWNGTKGALYYFGTHKQTEDRDSEVVFEGVGPGAGKTVKKDQAYYLGVGNGFVGPSNFDMEDGSYVKLREIALAYTLQENFIKELTGINSINIRLSARNLKTWTKYTGIDPETNLTGGTNLRGFDYFNNPQMRSIILSLRFNY